MEETHKTTFLYEGDASDLMRTIARLNERIDELENEVEDLNKKLDKTEKSTDKLGGKMRQFGRTLRQTSGGFQVFSRSAGKGLQLVGSFSTALGAAGVAAGGAGVAVVALSVGVVAVGQAAVSAGQAIFTLAASGRELREEAEQFPGFISEEEVRLLVRTDDAMEAARLAAVGLGVTVVSKLSPAIESVTTHITAMIISLRETPAAAVAAAQGLNLLVQAASGNFAGAVNAFAQMGLALEEVFTHSSDFVEQAQKMNRALADNRSLTDAAAASTRNLSKELDELMKKFEAAQDATAALAGMRDQAAADTPEEQLELSFARQLTQINALIEAGGDRDMAAQAAAAVTNRFLQDQIKLQEEQAEKALQQAEAEEKLKEQRLAMIESDSFYAELLQDSADLESATEKLNAALAEMGIEGEDAARAQEKLQNAIITGYASSLTQGLGAIDTLFSTAASLSGKHQKKMARLAKATGIAQATVSTFVGATKALELGPILGPPAMASQILLGLAQVAQIAATPLPGSDHTGSSAARTGLMSDEFMGGDGRVKLRQEMVTTAGTINSTGTNMVDDLNNGRLSGSGAPITAVIGRTHLDTELFASSRRGTSRFSNALRNNPHPKPNKGY